MGWRVLEKAERRDNGLYQFRVVGDWGDPLAFEFNSTSDIGLDWSAFTWRSQIRYDARVDGDPLAAFEITDNGSTTDELHILLALADTAVLPRAGEVLCDIRSTAGPVVGYTVGRGVLQTGASVTRLG